MSMSLGYPKRAIKGRQLSLELAAPLPRSGQGFELIELAALPQSQQGVSRLHQGFRRRAGDHRPSALLEGDDDQPEVRAQPARRDGRPGELAPFRHLRLLDL